MHEVFLDGLRKLNTRFMGMGIDVSESIEEATQAFVDHDKKLAQSLVKDDQKVSRAATKVEKRTLKLMALQQPVASDFRNVISILKATGDLERIGENALSIAWETIRVKGNPRIPEVETIIKSMSKKVNFMLDQVLKAYVQGDEKLAREVAKKDDEVDEDYVKARKLIIVGIKQDPEAAVASSSYFMVIRLLERIGDHVVNLAQWVVYKMSGELVDLNTKDTDEMTEL
ncbi:phosphate transport system regulatory protein PhoU [Lactobacillus paragasseri JV-V03]|uniref:Phosphate-specific transport system accessory protein PhoU n=1 Tax=Lactobacillus paragasseri JV-V03 TaxID=525326 RepID=A0AA87DMZ2_9LACO|nr:phosphate signaling complex protein PhoU [Lactobacillus paragasseri]EFJ70578.1 phosphate transport system regulatory protein PhoU [Lactobacillus paragasseri JV-V03]